MCVRVSVIFRFDFEISAILNVQISINLLKEMVVFCSE